MLRTSALRQSLHSRPDRTLGTVSGPLSAKLCELVPMTYTEGTFCSIDYFGDPYIVRYSCIYSGYACSSGPGRHAASRQCLLVFFP